MQAISKEVEELACAKKARCSKLQTSLKRAERELSEAKKGQLAAEEREADTAQQLNQLREEAQQAAAAAKRASCGLQEHTVALRVENKALQAELNNLRSKTVSACDARDDREAELQEDLKKAEAEHARAKRGLQAAEAQAAHLRQQNAALSELSSTQTHAKLQLEAEVSQQRVVLDEMRAAEQQLKEQRSADQAAIATHCKEISSLQVV